MKYFLAIFIAFLILMGCSEDNGTNAEAESQEITFVLSEGGLNAVPGSLWQIKDDIVSEVAGNPTGNVSQSMAIYNNQLLVINNGTGNIVEYFITADGIVSPTGNVIDLDGSQPREIEILNGKAYITQWLKHSIVVINLSNMSIESQITTPGATEGITNDGINIYSTIKYLDTSVWPYPPGNSIIKINTETNTIIDTFIVLNNPDHIIYYNNFLYIGSQYGNYPNFGHITEKVDPITGDVLASKDHGSEFQFGVDFAIYEEQIYRAYNKGIISIDNELNLDQSSYIETSQETGLYSMAIINELIYLGFGDNTAPDQVIVLDFEGNETSNFEVGASPGSFALWQAD